MCSQAEWKMKLHSERPEKRPTLSRDEKVRIARLTIEVVNQRVPVVIGAGGSDTKEVIREIEDGQWIMR